MKAPHKVKHIFHYSDGIFLRIVTIKEHFLNSYDENQMVTMTRVIAPNGGNIGVQIMRGQSIKEIVENTKSKLDQYAIATTINNVKKLLTSPMKQN